MSHNFSGIQEKLKRSHENIRNLESEIGQFFKSGKYVELPENDDNLLLEAIQYHKNRVIPLRFSVLAGEIVHHLRSCLDHVVWEFSMEAERRDHPKRIEFPVLEAEPTDKDSISSYERKIKGVVDTRVREIIERLQPYKSPNPIDNPLLILHKMDIVDKHRELVLCASTGAREIPMNNDIARILAKNESRISGDAAADLALNLKGHGKLVPQVAFREFGSRAIKPVVLGLAELNNYIVNVMEQFSP
jgi:hypothetical protein